MKRCPGCASSRHYRLNDGRLKCRACGRRFSWTSAWDSVRLPAATKQRLLELFVLGVPCHRQVAGYAASAISRERFYRLLRACCVRAEFPRAASGRAVATGDTGQGGRGQPGERIVFGLARRDERVEAIAVHPLDRPSIVRGIEAHAHGGALYYTDAWQAYVALEVRGRQVMIPAEERRPAACERIPGIGGFWSYARRWLRTYRCLPRQYFHLYLSEACYRYNHRGEDLERSICALAGRISIQELRPVLVPADCWPG